MRPEGHCKDLHFPYSSVLTWLCSANDNDIHQAILKNRCTRKRKLQFLRGFYTVSILVRSHYGLGLGNPNSIGNWKKLEGETLGLMECGPKVWRSTHTRKDPNPNPTLDRVRVRVR